MTLLELESLSVSVIWALANPVDKKIFISYSNNILSSLSRNISEILDNSHSCRQLISDYNRLELMILETPVPSNQLKVKSGHYMDHYKDNGWSLYKANPPVKYTVKTLIAKDCKAHVVLVNKRNDKLVVGVFDTMHEADEFTSSAYPNNTVTTIIYSQNSLSKEFLRKRV